MCRSGARFSQIDEKAPNRSPCIRCATCDGYPCLVRAKSDAQVLAVDPALAPLADNGGPTFTQAVLGTSPARDGGSNAAASALTTDQRGGSFNRTEGKQTDIGAYEFPAPSASNVVIGDGTSQRSVILSLKVTLPPGTIVHRYSA